MDVNRSNLSTTPLNKKEFRRVSCEEVRPNQFKSNLLQIDYVILLRFSTSELPHKSN